MSSLSFAGAHHCIMGLQQPASSLLSFASTLGLLAAIRLHCAAWTCQYGLAWGLRGSLNLEGFQQPHCHVLQPQTACIGLSPAACILGSPGLYLMEPPDACLAVHHCFWAEGEHHPEFSLPLPLCCTLSCKQFQHCNCCSPAALPSQEPRSRLGIAHSLMCTDKPCCIHQCNCLHTNHSLLNRSQCFDQLLLNRTQCSCAGPLAWLPALPHHGQQPHSPVCAVRVAGRAPG